MLEIEKIKKGLDTCALRSAGDCTCCPYFENTYCDTLLASDAAEYIESLEERISIMQESMEALEKRNEPKRPKWFTDIHFPTGAFVCSECETRIVEKGVDFYCPKCGQAVKWDG